MGPLPTFFSSDQPGVEMADERNSGPGLSSWHSDIVAVEVDQTFWQCKGKAMHVFQSQRDPGVCPQCGEELGYAPASTLKRLGVKR